MRRRIFAIFCTIVTAWFFLYFAPDASARTRISMMPLSAGRVPFKVRSTIRPKRQKIQRQAKVVSRYSTHRRIHKTARKQVKRAHRSATVRHSIKKGNGRLRSASAAKRSGKSKLHASRKRSHRKHRKSAKAHRRAYPLGLFMRSGPKFDARPFAHRVSRSIKKSFAQGVARSYDPHQLVRAGAFTHYPLSGGIYKRRKPIKFIVMHSTETESPADARRVIRSWNNGGISHPGTPYVVDRDGTIYQTVHPDLATVHINVFKTIPGIDNDNSLGIEMVRSGRQKYTTKQYQSVLRLVTYLQDRYGVADANVVTHSYVQPSNRRDPVNFNWEQFLCDKSDFRSNCAAVQAKTTKASVTESPASSWVGQLPRILGSVLLI